MNWDVLLRIIEIVLHQQIQYSVLQSAVPSTSTVTYPTFVLDYCPFKDKPYRVRITVGGDISQYTEDA